MALKGIILMTHWARRESSFLSKIRALHKMKGGMLTVKKLHQSCSLLYGINVRPKQQEKTGKQWKYEAEFVADHLREIQLGDEIFTRRDSLPDDDISLEWMGYTDVWLMFVLLTMISIPFTWRMALQIWELFVSHEIFLKNIWINQTWIIASFVFW